MAIDDVSFAPECLQILGRLKYKASIVFTAIWLSNICCSLSNIMNVSSVISSETRSMFPGFHFIYMLCIH